MTKQSIILFDLKNKKTKEKIDITRKLFGFEDKSNNSKYTYTRKGLLADIKYSKWNKVTILIDSEDEEKTIKILKKFGLNTLITRLPD